HAAFNFAFESALRQRDSGALTGALAEMLFEFILFIAPFVGIGRRFALAGDIRPDIREFPVNLKILVGTIIRVRTNCFNRAFRLANAAIDAFVRVDYQHIIAFVEAVHRAYFDAIHEFAFDARIFDDVRHTVLRVLLDGHRRDVWPTVLNPHGCVPHFRLVKLVFFKAPTNNFYNAAC
ncbi:MAG: hypothetical protein ACI9MU_001079, partial [Alphaproteobacteria bacterium]